MPLNDVLLHLDSYPDPTPDAAIDHAVALARRLEAKVTAFAPAVRIPVRSNRLADYLIGLSAMAKEWEAASRGSCQAEVARFTTAAQAAGVFADAQVETVDLYDVPDRVAQIARTRDLTIVPLADRFDGQAEVAQTAIFQSGRPVIVFRALQPAATAGRLDEVVLAWDGSRGAARAMADALPILVLAKSVRVLTVAGEKPAATADLGAEAVRHLQAHGVSAVAATVDAEDRRIGEVLDAELKARPADLLVMGAYGHSRMQEFILGGATEHVLKNPPIPTLLSH